MHKKSRFIVVLVFYSFSVLVWAFLLRHSFRYSRPVAISQNVWKALLTLQIVSIIWRAFCTFPAMG